VQVAIVASLLLSATMVKAESSSASQELGRVPANARDPFARIIDRSDAVVLGRVLDAGFHEIPIPGGDGRLVTSVAYARIAVERWIVGPDTNPIVEVGLGQEVSPSLFLEGRSTQADRRVIVYLVRSHGKWGVVHERSYELGTTSVGLEVLPLGAALGRITAIRDAAKASSPESLAVRADLVVVGNLERFTDHGVICHVERVVAGTSSTSELIVVPRTPGDLRLGKALLFLGRRPDSMWEPLDDSAGCFYLDQDRVAHLTVPTETLLTRVAIAHARRAGGEQR
jgi:hypothetical protein